VIFARRQRRPRERATVIAWRSAGFALIVQDDIGASAIGCEGPSCRTGLFRPAGPLNPLMSSDGRGTRLARSIGTARLALQRPGLAPRTLDTTSNGPSSSSASHAAGAGAASNPPYVQVTNATSGWMLKGEMTLRAAVATVLGSLISFGAAAVAVLWRS
jgi:hypothetical protein